MMLSVEPLESTMINLLTRYRTQPTAKNALAVRTYGRKHPFAVCLLDAEMSAILSAALLHANGG